MAMAIVGDRIGCGSCELECPRGAISPAAGRYRIDPERCTECRDEGGSRCAAVCPIEGIASSH